MENEFLIGSDTRVGKRRPYSGGKTSARGVDIFNGLKSLENQGRGQSTDDIESYWSCMDSNYPKFLSTTITHSQTQTRFELARVTTLAGRKSTKHAQKEKFFFGSIDEVKSASLVPILTGNDTCSCTHFHTPFFLARLAEMR
jgi:hypothetical protein